MHWWWEFFDKFRETKYWDSAIRWMCYFFRLIFGKQKKDQLNKKKDKKITTNKKTQSQNFELRYKNLNIRIKKIKF